MYYFTRTTKSSLSLLLLTLTTASYMTEAFTTSLVSPTHYFSIHHHSRHHHVEYKLDPLSTAAITTGKIDSSSSRPTTELHATNDSGSKRGGGGGRRQPWDFFRFLNQSSKFISLPRNPIQALTTVPRSVRKNEILYVPTTTASTSTSKNENLNFAPLDDVVMGGVSSSTFDNGTGIWKGQVTDINNGGFVGIRSLPFERPWNMQDCSGLELKLRTVDPKKGSTSARTSKKQKRFKAIVRDSAEFNGICWTSSFDMAGVGDITSPSISTVRLPFRKMVPTLFARTVPSRTLRLDNIMGVQLAYSKFEYDGELNPNFEMGDFGLQILEIRAY